MLKLLVITGCVLVGAVWAYDFTDSDFNKVLLDDLLEYDAFADEELPPIVHFDRNRRSAEEPPATVATTENKQKDKCKGGHGGRGGYGRCCNDNYEHSQEMKDLKRQCFAEAKKARKAKHHGYDGDFDVFSCEKVERAKEKVLCAMECVARKQQLIDDLGNPDEQKVKEHLRKNYKEDAWQLKEIDNIVDFCLAEVATKIILESPRNVTAENDTEKCSPASSIFTHCTWRQLTMRCPTELQDQSNHCQRMREKINRKEQQSTDTKPAELTKEPTPVVPEPPKVVAK